MKHPNVHPLLKDFSTYTSFARFYTKDTTVARVFAEEIGTNNGINISQTNDIFQQLIPPYRMPPQPPGSSPNVYIDGQIPGSTPLETINSSHNIINTALRTHSSKFPIEREVILSGDKGSTKIPLMNDRTCIQLLHRISTAVAPDHPPKQTQAWNSTNQSNQSQHQQIDTTISTLTGAIPRTPARLPEDVTALAERENYKERDLKDTKNAVSKTYHTIKDLISSKFKKDSTETGDELNNVVTHQPQNQILAEQDELKSPYSALPLHMRQMQTLNQSQPNIWNSGKIQPGMNTTLPNIPQQTFVTDFVEKGVQQRAASQPQLNFPFERQSSHLNADNCLRRDSIANIDITDSDEGGFVTRNRRSHGINQINHQHQNGHKKRGSPLILQSNQNGNILMTPLPYTNGYQQQNLQTYTSPYMHVPTSQVFQAHSPQQTEVVSAYSGGNIHPNDVFLQSQKEFQLQQQQQKQQQQFIQQQIHPKTIFSDQSNPNDAEIHSQAQNIKADIKVKQIPSSAASSDYDKSGNHSSNVDSGRGSAVYSSGRKGLQNDTSPNNFNSLFRQKDIDSDWVDIADVELRNILEPSMKNLNIRPESTVSGSVSSITPPLPPLSPDCGLQFKPNQPKEASKLEYGADSYNRPGKSAAPISPSRAGWPGPSLQRQSKSKITNKKQEQTLLKRHLFGLDNDQASTTTRSLDLDSLLGGPWGQSVSDSETDTHGLRHIRSQLEGLEHMYSEVLRMLSSRAPNGKIYEAYNTRSARRRHGSLSSLPSSSVSSRPIHDRRRNDDRRKIRDMRSINRRFQRLESHVVTLARSVAHLSSEMRSQHLVTQELERLRDDLATLRVQAIRSQNIFGGGHEPEPPNLTNPKRVKKLTKFFGEDPPLMRLFLKKLGYEKYATLFEAERVGMIELPYLGEERLQKLGVPLGPRLRILQEAQISLCKDTTLCIV